MQHTAYKQSDTAFSTLSAAHLLALKRLTFRSLTSEWEPLLELSEYATSDSMQ